MLATRVIKIQAIQPHQLFTFYPKLSGGAGEMQLKKKFNVTTDTDGEATIILQIGRWTCVPPTDFCDKDAFDFDLVEGNEITLDTLFLAGTFLPGDAPVYKYLDDEIKRVADETKDYIDNRYSDLTATDANLDQDQIVLLIKQMIARGGGITN